MTSNDPSVDYGVNETLFRGVSFLLVAAMIACSVVTLGSLISQWLPSWSPWVMGAVCFVISLDSLYTRHLMKKQDLLRSSWLTVAATQVVVIVLIIKLVTGLSHGLDSFLDEIPLWSKGFAEYFITYDLLIGLVMAVITWFVSGYFGELLDGMTMAQAKINLSLEIPDKDAELLPREKMMSMIFTILLILVVLTALVRIDLNHLFNREMGSLFFKMGSLSGGGASTLLFFMFGLALLSQTQFNSLHTRWGLSKIPVTKKLAGQWALYSILFLLMLALVAAMLPTHYSLGFLAALGVVLDYVVQGSLFILQIFFALLTLLINLPFLLMGRTSPIPVDTLQQPEIPTPMPEEAATAAAAPGLDMTRQILFWVVFIGVVVFALSQYLRQHGEVLDALRRIPGWRLLSTFFAWVKNVFSKAGKGISHIVERSRARLKALDLGKRTSNRGSYINPRRLNPRQKVYFYYLALVRRGGEQGIPRQPSQTPSEYAQALDSALPVAEEDIDLLTDEFMEARYSRHRVENDDASRAKTTWEKIRKALRGMNRPRKG